MSLKPRTAVLISGNGSNLQALLDAAADPAYPAEISLVISNNAYAYGLERAAHAGVPFLVLDHRSHASRESYDAALHAALVEQEIELVCLAGFMRFLTAEFVMKWEGKMLNIHPSLLPAYKGLHTHRRVIEEGARFSGCTVHFVTPEMDAGPIIIQAALPVLPEDTEESLAERIHAAEHRIYPEALRLLATGGINVDGQRVRVEGASTEDVTLCNPACC